MVFGLDDSSAYNFIKEDCAFILLICNRNVFSRDKCAPYCQTVAKKICLFPRCEVCVLLFLHLVPFLFPSYLSCLFYQYIQHAGVCKVCHSLGIGCTVYIKKKKFG